MLDGVLPEYPSWRNYFDAVITGAAEARLLLGAAAARSSSGRPASRWARPTALERGRSYEGGDLATFERLLGIGGDRVLYVGDHIYGDILRSKKSSLWRTCMVVRGARGRARLARRGTTTRSPSWRGSRTLRVRVEDEIAVHRSALNVLDRRLERDAPDAGRRARLEAGARAREAGDRVAARGAARTRNDAWRRCSAGSRRG